MAFLAGVAILGVIGLVGALLAWLLRPTAVVKPKMATSGEPAPLQQTEEVGEAGAAVAPAPDRPLRTHPLYKRIAVLSGQVNAMRLAEVKEALQKRSLASRGFDPILFRRLKVSLRREAILADSTAPTDLLVTTETNPYQLDYLCVLDFEATCEEPNPPDYVHEIIEFPVILLNLKTLKVEEVFHHYCRPILNPVLSEFCKRLTGIHQEQVNAAHSFPEVFQLFTEWLESKGVGESHKFSLVTDCPWDIKECLFPQCVLARVPFPSYAIKWIDARKLYASFYQMKSGNLAKMLEYLGFQFQGREHCGLHDTQNIVRIILQLISDGCVLKYNRFMPRDILSDFALRGRTDLR